MDNWNNRFFFGLPSPGVNRYDKDTILKNIQLDTFDSFVTKFTQQTLILDNVINIMVRGLAIT